MTKVSLMIPIREFPSVVPSFALVVPSGEHQHQHQHQRQRQLQMVIMIVNQQ